MSTATAESQQRVDGTPAAVSEAVASSPGSHDTAARTEKSQAPPASTNGSSAEGHRIAMAAKTATPATVGPRLSPSPSISPKPENEPVVVRHLREMFTDISDTLITDAYRFGLVNGTTEQMYVSFYNRAQRIVEQLIQKHGPELYLRVMQDNLVRLLSVEFKECTPQKVYDMCDCCLYYQNPTMLFTSLLSTDCLEQLIECTDAMLREEDQMRSRHPAPRSRHGGGAGGNAEHGGSSWYGGSRNAAGPVASGGGGGLSNTNPNAGAAGRHRGGAAGSMAGGGGGGLGGGVPYQASMGGGAGADAFVHQGPLPATNPMSANNQGRNQMPDAEMALRFASSPRSPNGGAGVSASSYHSIPAPRGLTAGYVVRSEEGSAPSTIKQPLPRSAVTLMQQQQQQQQQQQRLVHPQMPQQQLGGNGVDRLGNASQPPRSDMQVPAAFLRDPPSAMGRPAPVPQFAPVVQNPDLRKSPSPQSVSDRAPPPPRRFAHHHHHHVGQPMPGSGAPSMAGLSHSQSMEAPRSAHSVPSSPPPPASNRPVPSTAAAAATASGGLQSRTGVTPPAHHHHHHHHLQMHRDPFMNVSSQPSMSRQSSQLSGSTASPMMPRPMEGMQQPSVPTAHMASPQPPQPAGTPGSLAPAGTGTPQPSASVQQQGAVRVGSLPRPHHHHHHHMHTHMFPQAGAPASPYQTTPLGVTGPADGGFSASYLSSPPGAVARDTASSVPVSMAQARPTGSASSVPSVMPRHHHHHHHLLQTARPGPMGGVPDGLMQRPPSSIDAGAAAGSDETRDPAWRGSPATMAFRAPADPSAAADEVTSYLMRAGVDQRTATNVAATRCTLGDLRSLPWSQTEHLLRVSGVPPSSFPALRESLVGPKEESSSQLQQFLQRNNIAAHSINSSTANDSTGTPLGSASTQSLSQRDSASGRGGLHVPQPRTRQTGSNSHNGSPLMPTDANDVTGSPSSSGTGRAPWGGEVSTDSAVPEGGRGRRGKIGGGRGGGRGGRGGGEDAQICKYYKKPEGCQFGSNCRYRHVDV